jgi:uncharacterized membrane protein
MAKATRMNTGALKGLPLGTHAGDVRRRVEAMEQLLERSFRIPGTKQTIGLDVILDVIPVGGDVIAAVMGLYMVWEAQNLKMPMSATMRMLGNVGVDFLLGLVPVVGVIPDFFFRSNSRNLRIIKKHLDKHHPGTAVINQ